MPYVNVDINVELDEFSDDDLLDEVQRRKLLTENDVNLNVLIEKIYLKRIFGLNLEKEIDNLIYQALGRIV